MRSVGRTPVRCGATTDPDAMPNKKLRGMMPGTPSGGAGTGGAGKGKKKMKKKGKKGY